jgi:hypothetical protein
MTGFGHELTRQASQIGLWKFEQIRFRGLPRPLFNGKFFARRINSWKGI